MKFSQRPGNRSNYSASSSQPVYPNNTVDGGDAPTGGTAKKIPKKMFSSWKRSELVEYCEKFDIEITSETNLVDVVINHFENHLEVPEDSVLMTDLISQFLLNPSPRKEQHLARRSLHEISTQYRNLSQQNRQ